MTGAEHLTLPQKYTTDNVQKHKRNIWKENLLIRI